MPMDASTQTYLTNDARKRELRQKVASAQGEVSALANVAAQVSNASNDAQSRLNTAKTNLANFEAGGGPGVTDDFGPFSTTDQALQKERDTGKSALIDYIKANPNCLEADAIAQWKIKAMAGRPADRQWLLHDPQALRYEYSANLVAGGYITDNTWAKFAAWVVATPKDTIMNT